MFGAALIALLVTVTLALVLAFKGPTVFDRALDGATLRALFASPVPLHADRASLSLSTGGTQTLTLDAGPGAKPSEAGVEELA